MLGEEYRKARVKIESTRQSFAPREEMTNNALFPNITQRRSETGRQQYYNETKTHTTDTEEESRGGNVGISKTCARAPGIGQRFLLPSSDGGVVLVKISFLFFSFLFFFFLFFSGVN